MAQTQSQIAGHVPAEQPHVYTVTEITRDVRAILAVDGALLVQTGSTILGWTHE